MLTVTTIAPTKRLTTRARVKTELGLSGTASDALLDDLIDRASAAIESYCHRPFAREAYTETLPGLGGVELALERTPLVGSPSSVDLEGQLVTDYSVASADESVLYRRNGWGWTIQSFIGLTGTFRSWEFGSPIPRTEQPLYTVSYVAGYILPPQDVIAASISVDGADNSFNDAAAGFPALLKAGDVVITSGFTAAANNGRFVVAGSPTTSKVVVSSTLTTEAAAADRNVFFQSLPFDIEKAAIETTKSYYATRADNSQVVEKQVGPMRIRYADPIAAGGATYGLPSMAVGLLRPWVRVS